MMNNEHTEIAWVDNQAKEDYFALISSASKPELKVTKESGNVYAWKTLLGGHVHHVIPRSIGGLNVPDNLVDLSYGDHLRAHFLLSKGTEDEKLRRAYSSMLNRSGIGGESDNLHTLTDEMIDEYSKSCERVIEAARKARSKPVCFFDGYLNSKSYRFFNSLTECTEYLGLSVGGVDGALRTNKRIINKGGTPRPKRFEDGPIKKPGTNYDMRIVIADPEWEWTQKYIELGHAPHINPKLLGSRRNEN